MSFSCAIGLKEAVPFRFFTLPSNDDCGNIWPLEPLKGKPNYHWAALFVEWKWICLAVCMEKFEVADILRIALVGAGRIGKFHARHICELSRDDKNCQLVAIVDPKPPRTHAFMEASDIEAQVFTSVEELIAADVCDAALVASSTDTHYAVTKPLIDAGLRVMMEKPMTESLESDREFTKYLNETAPHALMLAFQRRFDEPLCYAKEQLEQNRIGRPFKFISILEDSGPPPDG